MSIKHWLLAHNKPIKQINQKEESRGRKVEKTEEQKQAGEVDIVWLQRLSQSHRTSAPNSPAALSTHLHLTSQNLPDPTAPFASAPSKRQLFLLMPSALQLFLNQRLGMLFSCTHHHFLGRNQNLAVKPSVVSIQFPSLSHPAASGSAPTFLLLPHILLNSYHLGASWGNFY